jgi:hypothetical protein
MLSRWFGCLVCAATSLACLAVAPADAQPLDKRVYFTFNAPITLPGVTLPAGTYLFRRADAGGSVVQVLSKDGKQAYAMIFAIPAQRPAASETPEVRFMETPAGTAPAIRTWWYPAESTGVEFIYPKDQARRLAKGSDRAVLTTRAETTRTSETETKDLTRISASGQETTVDSAAAPTSAAPTGNSTGGEIAPPTLEIPASPIPAGVK